jgi:hypothetical protein
MRRCTSAVRLKAAPVTKLPKSPTEPLECPLQLDRLYEQVERDYRVASEAYTVYAFWSPPRGLR